MIKKALIILADGFEESEAIVPIDLLRRAKVNVTIAGLSQVIKSARNISIIADILLTGNEEFDMLILPGGQPGTSNLKASSMVLSMVQKSRQQGKFIAAICAAPSVLAAAGILDNIKITCFPGTETECPGAIALPGPVVIDGAIITSKGMGTAIPFGLVLVEALTDKATADSVGRAIQYIDH